MAGEVSYGESGLSLGFSMGGIGGTGGKGGNVTLNASGDKIETQGFNSTALYAQSTGGGGGAGGFSVNITVDPRSTIPFSNISASLGGTGGTGGTGGDVSITSTVKEISTNEKESSGIFAQSIGGGGGHGGFSSAIAFGKKGALSFSMGGNGGTGNTGGAASIASSSNIYTSGERSYGIYAQSVGGGGGAGGFSITGDISTTDFGGLATGLSIGGNGGTGGDSGKVRVDSTGLNITTKGNYSSGIFAQSTGGGGGDGSFSLSVSGSRGYSFAFPDVPVLNLGSKGGGGGKAEDVIITNKSNISTKGDFAEGIFAQSIGGGGGKGGSKIKLEVQYNNPKEFKFGVGAQGVNGAGGGDAGNVEIKDTLATGEAKKTITTAGNHAPGIYAESTGGGGGKGGWSFDAGVSTENDPLLPQFNIAMGGSGGAGGKAGYISVITDSDIQTEGERSGGIIASSIGGGGGDGGIAVSVATKIQPTKTKLAALSVAMGGSGGSGNTAGYAAVNTSASNIKTAGNNSPGISAQSTGGGGGNAGGSISLSFDVIGGNSGGSISASMGGSGGTGGEGGQVSVYSRSSISTGSTKDGAFSAGNDSPGIFAQSIGGGGGSGGFSISGMFNISSGDKNGGIALSIGGKGGSGNVSKDVTVETRGSSIQTLGDRSPGISAQSTGGGGGSGGFSIAAGLSPAKQKINGELSFSMGGNGGTGGNAGMVSVYNYTSSIQTGMKDEKGVHGNDSPAILAHSTGGGGGHGGFSIDGSVTMTAALTPSIGGSGGTGGTGGGVSVQNSGAALTTLGDRSPGISAQSIGGGGGAGGFSITGSLAVANLGVSIGGSGGNGGTGDEVDITNSADKINTSGLDSPGISAQSIGGGGGYGGFSVDSFIGAGGIGVSIGGSGGTGGTGGKIVVEDTGKEITTTSQRSPGILAQSIGAGGGQGGVGVTVPLGAIPVPISIGGSKGASGDGGAVKIETNSSITTKHRDSQGIIAQSIGAGGGTGAVNAEFTGESGTLTLGAKYLSKGDGGSVQIRTTGAGISTGALNSTGILTQSIGGGGGIGSIWTTPKSIGLGADNSSGKGGSVFIENSSTVNINGLNSHGIIAQSIGAGGGIVQHTGSASSSRISGINNASGDGGDVEVMNKADITLPNMWGYGIIAQSIGGGGGIVSTTSYKPLTPQSGNTGDGTNSGSGGAVKVTNNGNITIGTYSVGIFAQSIGGGGGLDMASCVASYDKGSGKSGDVTVIQNGSIKIDGHDSIGIFAQSNSKDKKGNISINVNGSMDIAGNNSVGILTNGNANVNIGSSSVLNVRSDSGSATPFKLTEGGSVYSYGKIVTNGPLYVTDNNINMYFNNYGNVQAKNITLSQSSSFMHYSGNVDLTPNNGEILIDGGMKDSPVFVFPVYKIFDGTLNVEGIKIATGEYKSGGIFFHGGGTVSVTSNIVLGNVDSNIGQYYYNDGVLNAKNIIVNPGGAFIKKPGSSNTISVNLDQIHLNGGYMEGSGTIAANVLNGGKLNPGNSVGTLTIDGRYKKLSGGTLITEIASTTDYDMLKVIGTPGTFDFTAGGDILKPILLRGAFRPTSGQVFPKIGEAAGGVVGTIDSVKGNPTMIWDVTYYPNSIDLVLKGRDYAGAGIGLTSNQSALGRAFNRVQDVTDGDIALVLNNIDYLEHEAEVKDAYKQIAPEKATALSAMSMSSGLFQVREQAKRLVDQRFSGFAGLGASGLKVNYTNGGKLMLAYSSNDISGLLAQKTSREKPWGFYIYPMFNWGNEATTSNQTGYNFTSAGFTTGIDVRIKDNIIIGGYSGFTQTDSRFRGSGGSVEARTFPIAAYSMYLGNSWYTYGSLGYALNLYDMERDIIFGGINREAKSETTGHQLNAYGEAGYDVPTRGFIFTPVVSMSYSGLWIDRYTEKGAGALNLSVSPQQAESFQSGLGGRISVPFKKDNYTIVPQFYTTYFHEFASGTRNIRASLSQIGSFTFKTDTPKRDFFVAGAKIYMIKDNNFKVDLNYNTDIGRGSSTSHSIYAGVRWEF